MPLLGSRGAASSRGFGSLANLGYFLTNSLRFRASNQAYLSRTPSVSGNRKVWTWSAWVKRGALDSGANDRVLFSSPSQSGNDGIAAIYFNGDKLHTYYDTSGANPYGPIGPRLYRDPAAWMHIVWAVDAANTIHYVYVDNTLVSTDAAYYPPNYDYSMNRSGYTHTMGTQAWGNTLYFDGYMAEINFVDGQALTPSSFGKTDSATGQWVPKKFGGAYGTNGFYLKFTDASAATAAAIGKDSSGNGNNWTPNGISVTAGATYDSMTDVPTLTSATAANYCVINPLSGTGGTVSNGNLEFVGPDSVWHSRNGTLAFPTSGQWYFEATLQNAPLSPRGSTSSYNWIGVGLATNFNVQLAPSSNQVNGFLWGDNGYINNFSSSSVDSTVALSSGDVMRLGIDTTNNTYTLYRNASLVASSTFNVTAGTQLVPYQISYSGTYGKMAVNFGQRPFAYPTTSGAFSGYKALNTYNLP